MSLEPVDVLIIGAGASGSALAYSLAETRMRIVCLEQGGWMNPLDYPSTILYAGHYPRFHPSDFRVRTLDGVADDWPLDYATLEPFYEENERMMGISGLAGDPAYPPKQPPMPKLNP